MKIFRNSGAAEAKACDSMPEMREWQAKATSSLVQSGGRPVPASDTSALALNSSPVAPTPLPLKLRDTWKLENPQGRKAPEDNAKTAPCPPPAKGPGAMQPQAEAPPAAAGDPVPAPLRDLADLAPADLSDQARNCDTSTATRDDDAPDVPVDARPAAPAPDPKPDQSATGPDTAPQHAPEPVAGTAPNSPAEGAPAPVETSQHETVAPTDKTVDTAAGSAPGTVPSDANLSAPPEGAPQVDPAPAPGTTAPEPETTVAATEQDTAATSAAPDPDTSAPETARRDEEARQTEDEARMDPMVKGLGTPPLEARANARSPATKAGGPQPPAGGSGNGGGGGGNGGARFHRRLGPQNFEKSLREGMVAVRRNMGFVMLMTCATNILVLAIPIYLFQISDRVLTSRSVDTLIMLTLVIAAAVVLQSVFDAVRRFMLMRTAVEVAARLGAPILSAAAHASLHSSGREYQALGDLQQVRSFLTSGTLMAFLDVPFAPLFMLAIFLVHPHLGFIVITTAVVLLVIAVINQRLTAKPFAQANQAQSRANLHLDSMTRNSQIINALAMIPEAVTIWGRDTAASLTAQVCAQDRNVISATFSRGVRLLTQVGMLGWGAYLAIQGEITGGMVIAASIIAGRALAPVEGAIEGWNAFLLSRSAYGRIAQLLTRSGFQFERLWLPQPEGRLDVERLLYVPGGTKQVVLNAISFSLDPGDTLAVIGNSGAGKTTLGKMLVGSILPTSGNVRLDLMDLRNWDPRQLGENIGYLPQDVQLFPGSIKDNIARMRQDATDEQIHRAAVLADVHDMIASLPQGYETMVAADGSPLSGGQKQRIALARAFFGDPRLLVLDEPNSNLDVAGDKALARAIEHAKRNKITVVVITQKPTLLGTVDKIMLLSGGNVAMIGARDTVLKQLAGFQQGQAPGLDNGAAPNGGQQ
ncbi:type I secretion system permease/ATPase [Epibacterium sp. Ofav1-8]|uniref:type I secretion system permease/ATPase n=1 Tax=Epibacterium sp. Ofav1-8 TaxID=2917735 RepID=UPI001EF4864D|nr:type I secretion system permease/ATPase [Epibacterium sp. Ofav1-8]